jgi:sialidase-1
MRTNRSSRYRVACILFATAILHAAFPVDLSGQEPRTAAGKPAEGPLLPFLGEAIFDRQVVFTGSKVREPYLAIAVDGTLLALRNNKGHLRRSEDAGQNWGEIIDVPIRHSDSNMIVDENTGHILSVRMWDGTDRVFRSTDHGKTWAEEGITLKPSETMKRLAAEGDKVRGVKGVNKPGTYYLHANASESGVTLRHGKHKGRLIVSATFRPHAKEHPSDRKSGDEIFSCAIFSDDGGSTWQVSEFFPEGFTEEAALVELHDGRIYYSSRSHSGFYDKAFARELRPDEKLRREAWSNDGGRTWEGLRISQVLPDGGGYGRGYGMKGGLTRLPVKGRDILIFSNADTGGGDRKKMTVWASFDGGQTWPVKRLVYESFSAYSSMVAGRPGTPAEGLIFLLFEGGPKGRYSAMQAARFNLSWILQGQPTGDGGVPQWVVRQ